jgi:hypothetical protein
MIKNMVKYFMLFSVPWVLTACSSKAYIQEITPVKSNISNYEIALVSVSEGEGSVKSKKGYTNVKSNLEGEFIKSLSATGKFKVVKKSILSNSDDGALNIDLEIEGFEYLSGAASVMGGVFSGNSYLKIVAHLIDAESGEVIGEIRSGAHTKSSHGVFRGSTGALITEVSGKLAAEISSYK